MLYDIKKSVAPTEVGVHPFADCPAVAQIGGVAAGFIGRIKDFVVLPVSEANASPSTPLLVITGSSDGAVRVWRFSTSELSSSRAKVDGDKEIAKAAGEHPQVGSLVGSHETGNRITCLAAFVLDGPAEEEVEDDEEEVVGAEEDEEDSESDSE